MKAFLLFLTLLLTGCTTRPPKPDFPLPPDMHWRWQHVNVNGNGSGGWVVEYNYLRRIIP